MSLRRITVACGFFGPAVMLVGTLAAVAVYQGREGERYSPLNHFISELGELGVSKNAPLFNACLIAGGLGLAGFMFGVGALLASRTSYLAAAVGVYCGLSCSAVGLVPMNHLRPHTTVAFSFFYSGLVAVALFTAAIILDRRQRASKWLVLPGGLTVLAFAAFLAIPHLRGVPHVNVLDPTAGVRPELWATPLFEWGIFVTILIWVLCVSFDLRARVK